MDWQLLALSFGTIFISELGDKSQMTTLCLSGNSSAPRFVFIGSALALVVASFIGVLLGESVYQVLPTKFLKAIAALIFALLAFRIFATCSEED